MNRLKYKDLSSKATYCGPFRRRLSARLKNLVFVAGLLTSVGMGCSGAPENIKSEPESIKSEQMQQQNEAVGKTIKTENNSLESRSDNESNSVAEELLPKPAPPILDIGTDNSAVITKRLNDGQEIKFREIKIKELKTLFHNNVVFDKLFIHVIDTYSTTKPPVNISFPFVKTDYYYSKFSEIDRVQVPRLKMSDFPGGDKIPMFGICLSSKLDPLLFSENPLSPSRVVRVYSRPTDLVNLQDMVYLGLFVYIFLPEHPSIVNFSKRLVMGSSKYEVRYTTRYELYGNDYHTMYYGNISTKEGVFPYVIEFDALEKVYKAMTGKELRYVIPIVERTPKYVRFYIVPADNPADVLKANIKEGMPVLPITYVTKYNVVYVGEVNTMLTLTKEPTLYLTVE